jgi:nucleotide-binding universal stress UspA family protein
VLYVRLPVDAREVFDPQKPADPGRYLSELHSRFQRARTRTEEGDPADRIVEVAREEGADLIVVGNRGLDERRRHRVLRSVPARVAHGAPCSVYIVDTRSAA